MNRREKLIEFYKKNVSENSLKTIMDNFATMYGLQKDIDLDNLELCQYEEEDGKRVVIYFREKKRKSK